jgi:hypothetical protein
MASRKTSHVGFVAVVCAAVCVLADCGTCSAAGWVDPLLREASIRDMWGTAPDDLYLAGDAGIVWHWDGSRFDPMDTGVQVRLEGIWGIASDNIVAVGPGHVVQWNGMGWNDITPGGHESYQSVWGAETGEYYVVTEQGRVWRSDPDGRWYWQDFHYPNFQAVWGTAADDVVVAGCGFFANGVFHWDGTAWSPMGATGDFDVCGIWGFSSEDIWVAGVEASLYHWNGTAWTWINPGGGYPSLDEAWGTSSQNMYFVGINGLIRHWDGEAWSEFFARDAAGRSFLAVWGVSDSDIYAAGQEGLLYRFDGSQWKRWLAPVRPLLPARHPH